MSQLSENRKIQKLVNFMVSINCPEKINKMYVSSGIRSSDRDCCIRLKPISCLVVSDHFWNFWTRTEFIEKTRKPAAGRFGDSTTSKSSSNIFILISSYAITEIPTHIVR